MGKERRDGHGLVLTGLNAFLATDTCDRAFLHRQRTAVLVSTRYPDLVLSWMDVGDLDYVSRTGGDTLTASRTTVRINNRENMAFRNREGAEGTRPDTVATAETTVETVCLAHIQIVGKQTGAGSGVVVMDIAQRTVALTLHSGATLDRSRGRSADYSADSGHILRSYTNAVKFIEIALFYTGDSKRMTAAQSAATTVRTRKHLLYL